MKGKNKIIGDKYGQYLNKLNFTEIQFMSIRYKLKTLN
jgi:hypothetical protein